MSMKAVLAQMRFSQAGCWRIPQHKAVPIGTGTDFGISPGNLGLLWCYGAESCKEHYSVIRKIVFRWTSKSTHSHRSPVCCIFQLTSYLHASFYIISLSPPNYLADSQIAATPQKNPSLSLSTRPNSRLGVKATNIHTSSHYRATQATGLKAYEDHRFTFEGASGSD